MKYQLHALVQNFAVKWGPEGAGPQWHEFLGDLREVLEAYGAAAILHESLPDTEHAHGDPV